MEQEASTMNIDDMTALELVEAMLERIEEHGAIGLQWEEGGQVLYCQLADEEDLVPSDCPEVTSHKPLH